LWEDPQSGVRGVFVVRLDGAPPPVDELSAQPYTVELRSVDVLAEGRGTVGVAGVDEGEWVVTVGQHLLGRTGGREASSARVRATSWQRVLELQSLQREDLLDGFLAEQRRVAAERGAVPPSSAEFLGDRETGDGDGSADAAGGQG
jgi:hypothetical protein